MGVSVPLAQMVTTQSVTVNHNPRLKKYILFLAPEHAMDKKKCYQVMVNMFLSKQLNPYYTPDGQMVKLSVSQAVPIWLIPISYLIRQVFITANKGYKYQCFLVIKTSINIIVNHK